MPRPICLPVARQSIQAAVYSQPWSDSSARGEKNHPGRRSGSPVLRHPDPEPGAAGALRALSVPSDPIRRSSRRTAPDSRWANRSGTARRCEARRNPIHGRPNVPNRWWFLPWTSLAMAPATLMKRVPGVTGSSQLDPSESGLHTGARTSASRTPASHSTMPLTGSKLMNRSMRLAINQRATRIECHIAVGTSTSEGEDCLIPYRAEHTPGLGQVGRAKM